MDSLDNVLANQDLPEGSVLKVSHETILALFTQLRSIYFAELIFKKLNILYPISVLVALSEQHQGHSTHLFVTCKANCNNVRISLNVGVGNPELYGQADSTPVISNRGDCMGCKHFCHSRRGPGTDESCEVSTSSNNFFVTVYAYQSYSRTSISFSNILSVTEIGKQLFVIRGANHFNLLVKV